VEWLDKMNDAISYIEAHIEEKISLAEAARIACCSISRFQRMFAFAIDVTITEYVRCRRMSLAACELLNSDIKVLDLALKYGYESPEAFTRAFQAFHGVTLSSVRKLGIHSKYPRISFQITMNGGCFNMGTKPLVRIEEHGMDRVVSFFVNCRGPEESAWNMLRNWVTTNLNDFRARRYIGCAPKGHHPNGEKHQPAEEIGSHEYMAQMFLFEGEGNNDMYLGADVCDAPKGLFLAGDVVMNEFNDDGTIDIGSSMQKSFGVMSECLKEMGGYEFELGKRPYFEEHIFTNEWFGGDGTLAGFKLWLPIRKVY
jgi:AraC family transcriptional regulator